MDIKVRKADLFRELQYVQGVVERKATVPILSNLLLETSGNALIVTATDLDVTIRCSCRSEVKVSGAVTVAARKLFDIVRLLPDAEIHLKSTDPEWAHLTCARSKFRVAGLSKENFPDIPHVEAEAVSLPAGPLRDMITRSIFAITQEESRYTLNGALMIVNPAALTLVTTDGHRLVLITHQCEIGGVQGESRVLIPKKTLAELSKLAADAEDIVEFGHSENHLFFKSGERLLISRVLTGQFPNYEMVIPRENSRVVTMNTSDLSAALKRAAVMAEEQSNAVRFAVSEGQIELSAANADYGEASDSLSASYSGEELTIGFNAQYVLDFLANLDSEQVTLSLKDSDTQGLMKPGEDKDYDYQYVVMPLKI